MTNKCDANPQNHSILTVEKKAHPCGIQFFYSFLHIHTVLTLTRQVRSFPRHHSNVCSLLVHRNDISPNKNGSANWFWACRLGHRLFNLYSLSQCIVYVVYCCCVWHLPSTPHNNGEPLCRSFYFFSCTEHKHQLPWIHQQVKFQWVQGWSIFSTKWQLWCTYRIQRSIVKVFPSELSQANQPCLSEQSSPREGSGVA